MALPWYTSLEDVKSALDTAETARSNRQVSSAIDGAARRIEHLCHRIFYPLVASYVLPHPDRNRLASSRRIWLGEHELATLDGAVVTIGGATVTGYVGRPSGGPPFDSIVLPTGAAGSLSGLAPTISGTFAGCALESRPAGALGEALDSSEVAVDVTDAALPGIGDVIKIDSERMIVIGKSALTTGQTLQTNLTASLSNQSVAVTTGAAFFAGETITLDAERMLVLDITGNTLLVKRAWDGSTLAAHTGSTIYAPRTLIVERGALGTTAAAHDTAAAITRHVPPAAITELNLAMAIDTMLQRDSGYARVVGSGEGQRNASGRSLATLRDEIVATHGRRGRSWAV